MEFSVSNSLVNKAISRVIGAINKNAVSEYLSAVKISITETQFLVEATNMDVVISSWFTVSDVKATGSFCVDAHALFEIIKKLPKDGLITFKTEKSNENLLYLIIVSGKSKFDLATIDVQNYPVILANVKENSVTLQAKDLSFLIEKTRPCIYANETRYNINGTLLNISKDDGKIYAVTTDGHRLAHAVIAIQADFSRKLTIPKKSVLEIKKIADSEEGTVTLDVSQTKMTFNFANSRLTTKLIDAEFPDYERVIPKDYIDSATINNKNFLAAIDRVSSIYSTATSEVGVRLNISANAVKIFSSKDTNRSSDELSATFSRDSEVQIMCNFVYLREILAMIDSENVKIFIKEANFPIMIQDSSTPNYFYIVMPMKV